MNGFYLIMWYVLKFIHKVKRFLIAHPDDGLKFYQLDNLEEHDVELVKLLRDPNNLLLFGSKMGVHPEDNPLTIDVRKMADLTGRDFVAFIRNFTNSKGNLFRSELILVYESGSVSYSCLNRFMYKWMTFEPTMWAGAERYYYYLDDPIDVNTLVLRLMGSEEFEVSDLEELKKFSPDPKAWRFKPLQDYVASLKEATNGKKL